MPATPRLLAGALVAGCTSLSSTTSHAQDATSSSILPPVTVTAKGYAGDDLHMPLTTIVVDREELRDSGANNVGEALRALPGLAVASDGAWGQNPVIRGLKRESVVLLTDGMRLNSAQPAGAIASFMSLGLADSVEVVKGSGSVLYGTGALGGVINVRLPQARFVPGFGLTAAANFDSASNGWRGTGVANISEGDHALMLGASLARIDDYRSPDGTVPLTGYDSDAFIGQYRFRIDSAQQLRVSLQQQTDRDVWYPGSAKPGMPPMLGTITMHSPKQERSLAEVGYSREGSGAQPLSFDLRAYRQEVRRQVAAFASGLGRDQVETDVTFVTDAIDARASWQLDPTHTLSSGINAWRMQASPERYLNNNPPAFDNHVRNDPFSDGQIDTIGVYLQDDRQFGKLNLLAGLRYDRVKGDAASMNNGATTTGLERTDDATTGSLGVIYEVAPLLRPYVNLSRGFRAGEMRERFESSPRGDGYYYLGNPQIRPEYGNQLEFGAKGGSANIDYRIAAYRTWIDDYITGRVTGATIAGLPVKQTENIGRVTLTGIDAQGSWQFTSGQWATIGYSRVRGENRDLDEPLFQMPADEASLGWAGHLNAGWSGDATVRMVARQDRVATIFSRGTENATPGFTTVDLGATYRWKRQSVRIALQNLTDKAYHEHLTEGISGLELEAPGRSIMINYQGAF